MRTFLSGATALATCAILAIATPATATAAPAPVEDHAMGSQIAKHEGVGDRRPPPDARSARESVEGIDVSSHQGNVDWGYWWGQGKRFAYVKATEGTSYRNPYFTQQYDGSYDVGMIRGAYHFALPDRSSGQDQADHFVDHGGGWSADGVTLPGALDMEYNPYGDTCYGMSKGAMVDWVRAFGDRYEARTGRWPVIYTSTNWWNQCAAGEFSSTSPLWVARYSSGVGTLPHDWGYHTFWQYTSSPIDQNQFNGAYDRLRVLATG